MEQSLPEPRRSPRQDGTDGIPRDDAQAELFGSGFRFGPGAFRRCRELTADDPPVVIDGMPEGASWRERKVMRIYKGDQPSRSYFLAAIVTAPHEATSLTGPGATTTPSSTPSGARTTRWSLVYDDRGLLVAAPPSASWRHAGRVFPSSSTQRSRKTGAHCTEVPARG